MNALRITTRVSAALGIAAALTCGTVVMASAAPTKYVCYGFGSGPSSAQAEQAAINDVYASYETVYGPFFLDSDTQSNGVWYAEVTSNCSGMLR